jgi:hypothetical protein
MTVDKIATDEMTVYKWLDKMTVYKSRRNDCRLNVFVWNVYGQNDCRRNASWWNEGI